MLAARILTCLKPRRVGAPLGRPGWGTRPALTMRKGTDGGRSLGDASIRGTSGCRRCHFASLASPLNARAVDIKWPAMQRPTRREA